MSKGSVIALGAGILVVIGAAVLAVILRSGESSHARSVPYGMAHAAAGQNGSRDAALDRPLSITSLAPAAGSRSADGGAPIRVSFSAPLAAGSAMPSLRPDVPGQWQISGSAMTFTPAVPLGPGIRVTLRIPAGPSGVRSAAGGTLARAATVRFTTSAYSQLRLAELLSQLGYLPLAWRQLDGGHLTSGIGGRLLGGGLAAQQEMAYNPPAGIFSWAHGYPAALHRQWQPGSPNVLVRGAVMAFESQHGMAPDGVASRQVWLALFRAAGRGQLNAVGYTYAIASKALPETLTIWHNGKIVQRSPANTGIPVAPTADGTFPVYLRFRFQIMKGTNPDGSHYADPVEFVAYFDGGDAVHYFPRGSYGSPQSLGCVELAYGTAAHAWPYLTYGSLVTVTG